MLDLNQRPAVADQNNFVELIKCDITYIFIHINSILKLFSFSIQTYSY